jgi:tRNA pseudouridine65 synthase
VENTEPTAGNLDILYQDEFLVVVNKPAGMLVHQGRDPEPRDQIAMKVLRDQIGQRVTTLHRLDRPTSGALLFALERETGSHLRKLFDAHLIEKQYMAVVVGETPKAWTCKEGLQKSEDEPEREAETNFKRLSVVERDGRTFTLLQAEPRTGRYHQIRRHLASGGFPIVGDYLYGEGELMDKLGEQSGSKRLLLHASCIGFEHPVGNDFLEVEAPLPERFGYYL